jgi:ELWxxDGT repeat protein
MRLNLLMQPLKNHRQWMEKMSIASGVVIEQLEPRCLLSSAAIRLTDIQLGAGDGLQLLGENVGAGDKFYFAASTDGQTYRPYVSDGTAQGTKLLATSAINPENFTEGGGFVYFTAQVGNVAQAQVFRTDIKTGATIQVSNLANQGTANFLAFANGHLIFSDTNNDELWRVDGTQSVLIASHTSGEPYAAVGNKLFFDDDERGLDVTDGTQVTSLAAVDPYIEPISAAFQGDLYFEGSDDAGDGLWVSNGTPAGTSRVSGVPIHSVGPTPSDFTVFNNNLYFSAVDSTGSATQIFRTDGISVEQLTTVKAGAFAANMAEFNGALYFTAGVSAGWNLYKFVDDKPVRVGTAKGGADGGTSPQFLTAVGNTLYFSAQDNHRKYALFETDGTTITLVPGDAGSDPHDLTEVNGNLFYSSSDSKHGRELHAVPSDEIPVPNPVHVHIGGEFDINQGLFTPDVNFTATVTGGTPQEFKWDFGDGSKVASFSVPPNAVNSFSHNYTNDEPGVYVAKCEMTTTDGRTSGARVLVTIHNVPPTIVLHDPPTLAVPGIPVTFNYGVIDPGTKDTFKVIWNFGDGSPAVTQSFGPEIPLSLSMSHTFTKTKLNATVSASVLDNHNGHDHISTVVKVRELAAIKSKNGDTLLIGHEPGPHEYRVVGGKNDLDVFIDGVLEFKTPDEIRLLEIAQATQDKFLQDDLARYVTRVKVIPVKN